MGDTSLALGGLHALAKWEGSLPTPSEAPMGHGHGGKPVG